MKTNDNPYSSESGMAAVHSLRKQAEDNGLTGMSLDEINAEISAARAVKCMTGAREQAEPAEISKMTLADMGSTVRNFKADKVSDAIDLSDFHEEVDVPNAETIAAIEEGRRMAEDKNAKSYTSTEELFRDLDKD